MGFLPPLKKYIYMITANLKLVSFSLLLSYLLFFAGNNAIDIYWSPTSTAYLYFYLSNHSCDLHCVHYAFRRGEGKWSILLPNGHFFHLFLEIPTILNMLVVIFSWQIKQWKPWEDSIRNETKNGMTGSFNSAITVAVW